MSMEHRAFLFDWKAFQSELLPVLQSALEIDRTQPLIDFIQMRLGRCRDPYEGLPLAASWRESLEVGDVQEVADFALTAYYQPSEDRGLGSGWIEVQSALAPEGQAALLGQPFGVGEAVFDPGRMGAYFQTPEQVARSLSTLRSAAALSGSAFLELLEDAVHLERGMYVTF